ncbi:MAG: TldD/PmbA family protein [Armatimonadota bacterium]
MKLLGQDKLRSLMQIALSHSSADQTEVSIRTGTSALTRFANSTIHQNMGFENVGIGVRAVFGKKVASCSGNDISEQGIRDLVDKAIAMVHHQDENPDFVSLPEPVERIPEVESYFRSTADMTPEDRANAVRQIVIESDRIGGTAAGSYNVSASEHGVMNSLGVDSYYQGTDARLTCVVTGPDGGFGYAQGHFMDSSKIQPGAIGAEASARAYESRNPVDVPPGDYECIMLPYAVCDMLYDFRYAGMGAMSYQEGHSFMCGKMGQKIVSDKISIWDDGRDPRTIAAPFDSEGVAKQHVDIIRNGVASGVLYGSYTAHREGKKSTGHSGGINLIMGPGDATIPEMIASTKRGIMMTRFHYANITHLMTAAVSGMTRDGTFLIEDGKIVAPVKNLRFNQSIVEALAKVEMVGKDLILDDGILAPAIKTGKFTFLSGTAF